MRFNVWNTAYRSAGLVMVVVTSLWTCGCSQQKEEAATSDRSNRENLPSLFVPGVAESPPTPEDRSSADSISDLVQRDADNQKQAVVPDRTPIHASRDDADAKVAGESSDRQSVAETDQSRASHNEVGEPASAAQNVSADPSVEPSAVARGATDASRPAKDDAPKVDGPAGTLIIGRRSVASADPDRRQLKPETKESIEGVIPQAPDSVELPDAAAMIRRAADDKTRSQLASLVGAWRQTSKNHLADQFEGGYRENEVRFGDDGTMEVRRTFDPQGNIILVRRVDFQLTDAETLTLGEKIRPRDGVMYDRSVELPSDDGGQVTITPPERKLPCKVAIRITETTIVIDGKTYAKQKLKPDEAEDH